MLQVPIPKFAPVDDLSANFMGRLVRELQLQTDSRKTVYVNQLASWYEKEKEVCAAEGGGGGGGVPQRDHCIGRGRGNPPPPHPGRPAYTQPLSPRRQGPGSIAFVTNSNRPQSLWQPPPTACLAAAGATSEVLSLSGLGQGCVPTNAASLAVRLDVWCATFSFVWGHATVFTPGMC